MKKSRVEKALSECLRLQQAISLLQQADSDFSDSFNIHKRERFWNLPRETAAVRRASMDLTRALSDMRKPDYEKLPGES